MEVAQREGAEYADIRIGVQQFFSPPSIDVALGYGVRARIGGTWGFQHGTLLTMDAVASAARGAVRAARMSATVNAKLGGEHQRELAPAPVVTGTWRSPVEIDPLAIPINDYSRILSSLRDQIARFGWVETNFLLSWLIETRIFASTSGSLVTQEFTRGGVEGFQMNASLPDGDDNVQYMVPGAWQRSAGFEAALDPEISRHMLEAVETAIRWRELPTRQFLDVGRYPVVLDGGAMASLVAQTANLALDTDRVAGFEADASGQSFLAPVTDIVRATTPAFAPLLTVASTRAVSSPTAVQWDDDGVVPDTYTVIDRGHVVDYHTTRETAPLLADWYARRGMPLRSHGGAVAPTPASIPLACSGDLHVVPATTRTSIDDLLRDMTHGFLILGGTGTAASSPNLTGGYLEPNTVIEVQRGKPTARLGRLWMAFWTKSMLRTGLVALGDASTLGNARAMIHKGLPWETFTHPVSAPAAYCKDIDVSRIDVSG